MPRLLRFTERILDFLLKALIILTPLFFLLGGWGLAEISRQIFVWIIVIAGTILLFGKFIFSSSKNVGKNFLDLPIIIFLLGLFLSSVVSNDIFVSFFGSFSRLNDGFLNILGLVSVYFLLTRGWPQRNTSNLFFYIFYSLLLNSIIFSIVLFFSVFISVIPATWQNNMFSGILWPVIAILNALLLIFSLNLFDFTQLKNKKNWLYIVAIVFSLFNLFALNSRAAWICLAVGAVAVLFLNILIKNKLAKINQLGFSLVALVALLVLLFANSSFLKNIGHTNLSGELFLSQSASANIVLGSLRTNEIFGSGPGSFGRVYSQFKNEAVLPANFYLARFNKPASFLFELLSSAGWLGLTSYLLIFIIFILGSLKLIIISIHKYSDKLNQEPSLTSDLIMIYTGLSSAISLFTAQIIFPLDSVILFYYWVIIAFLMIYWQRIFFKNYQNEPANNNLNKIKKAFLILFFLVALPVLFWVLSMQIKLARGEYLYQKEPNNENALIEAGRLAPRRYNYKLFLSRVYLGQAKSLMDMAVLDNNQKDQLRILIINAIKYSEEARSLAPNEVEVYEQLGLLYRDISSVAAGSDQLAISAFTKALELEPYNPVYLNELGKLFFKKKLFIEAADNFKRALKIRSDFFEAKFGLAKVYSLDGKENDALGIFAELETTGSDIEIFFEEGRIFFNQKKYNEAINKFLEVIKKYPNHANTLYSLGLTLEVLGRPDEAKLYFKKVLDLNPNNQTVIDKIKELDSKKK